MARVLKGQFFIISALFILIGLIMLKSLLGVYVTVEEERKQETAIQDKQLRNIKSEYEYTIGIASLQSSVNESGISNLYNLSSLMKSITGSKSLYLFIFVNGSTQKYSVTIGNFLGDKINANLSATNSVPSGYSIGDINSSVNVTRGFQADINGTIYVNITYIRQGSKTIETIPVQVSNNSVSGFFDITLEDRDLIVRSKDTCNITW